jgi:hypothetical protein
MAGMTPLPGMGAFGSPGGGAGVAGPDPTSPVAPSLGKNSKQQNLMSPHSGVRSTLAKGEPLSRAMNQYGKGHSFTPPLKQIRGGLGQMHRIRGGLGPGKMGEAGASDKDYSMTSADTE